MKKPFIIIMCLLMLFPASYAHDEPHPPLEVGESIVNLGLSCSQLDEEQVLAVGLYLYGDSKYQWWLKVKTYFGYCWRSK